MLAVHARYRGRSSRRADLVARSAQALATLPGVGTFDVLGVEDICAVVESPESVCDLVMALLSDGDWAIGIGVLPESNSAATTKSVATGSLPRQARAGIVKATVQDHPKEISTDIEAVFALLGQVLQKRTMEGREATSLVRRGLNQNEAAEALGISKQAVSQRLQAAGWQAETAGWQLAVNLLKRADRPSP
ncbi:MarR family transcriptional regulator [Corynebacterium poyangense]|uniref:MarR family transcriptional regulator n=1 Tax=Corynebacterium poyangense TaxID=2684405 RepID=A0A7H0SSA9_9CORY|nr:MarR family transcriptional regulator [Corynebacterium poyangense]MBZ8177802.1 MarR family transcriptional regulator [Corynebacterium poyangense]QNQ91434.1 MarR family transcriptional regulator [Corynebacterium poyangense]